MATTTQTNIDITENHICLRYMEAVRKECQYIDFLETGVMDREVSISSPTSSDIYVTPYFSEDYIDAHRMNDGKLPENILNLIDLTDSEKYKHLFLKGDPGIGKTTLLRRVAYTLCEPVMGRGFRNKMGEKLPILAVLRDISLKGLTTFDDFLDRIFEQSYLKNSSFKWNKESKKLFEKLLKQGQIIFLLDGLDEITDSDNRFYLSEIIRESIEDYANCFLWCTTRLTGFNQEDFWGKAEDLRTSTGSLSEYIKEISTKDDIFTQFRGLEISQLRRIKRNSRLIKKITLSNFGILDSSQSLYNTPDFKEIYLTPFDNEQIKKFMQQWSNLNLKAQYEANEFGERFLQSLLINTSVLHLARIPNMLTMMAMYYRVNERFPDGRYELYDKIVHSYLEIVDSKRNLQKQHRIETKHLRRCLAYLAYEMQKQRAESNGNELSISLEESKAKECFLKILKEEEANKSNEELNEQIEEFFSAIKKRSDLLVERSAGNFAFLHLSMQEFLCAEYLQRLWYKALRKRNLEEHWNELQTYADNDPWLEVILLYFEAFRAIKEREKEDFEEAFTKLCYENETIKANRLCGHLMADEYLSDFIDNKVKDEILAELVFESAMYDYAVLNSFFPKNWLQLHPKFWDGKRLLNIEDRLAIEWVWIKDKIQISEILNCNKISVLKIDTIRLNNQELDSILVRNDKIKFIQIEENEIESIESFRYLKHLKYLNFNNNRVSDISPLQDLKKIVELNFNNNHVSDISPLQGLINLKKLFVLSNLIKDIAPLKDLINLKYLQIAHNEITNIDPLKELINLEGLYFFNNEIKNIDALKGMKELHYLNLKYTKVRDLSILKHLKKLTSLSIVGNQFKDISPLAKLENLEYLAFSDNEVVDISSLQYLKNLISLSFSNNKVIDISSLQHMEKLESVSFSNNQVTDINILEHLANLREIELGNNLITDFKSLKSIYYKLWTKDFRVEEWEKERPKGTINYDEIPF